MQLPASVLVTGAGGQLGRALIEARWPEGLTPVGMDHRALDITDAKAVAARFAGHRFAAVINTAAYTQVDKAESEPAAAQAVNVEGPRMLARCCRDADIPLFHVSTDFVFDGEKPAPYVETDPTNPLSEYGRTKRDGEIAIAEAWPGHVILRTSWSYRRGGRNFVTTMLRLAEAGREVAVVDDQIGAPTHCADIAAALIHVLTHVRGTSAPPWGLYHFASVGAASRYEVASRIFAALRRNGLTAGQVKPVASADYPTPARRPLNSRLDTGKYQTTFGDRPAPWQDALDRLLDDYVADKLNVAAS